MLSFVRTLSQRRARRSLERRVRLAETLEPRFALTVPFTVIDDNWQAADGGIKDVNSGLVWAESFLWGQGSTYNYAKSQADSLVAGGFDDWRLPTESELKEGVSHGLANHVSLIADSSSAWTSTPATSKKTSDHVVVSNFDGVSSVPGDRSSFNYNYAVRGARAPETYSNPNIRVFSQELYVNENSSTRGRLTVALDTQPTADVTIPVASSDPSQGTVSVDSLIFTPSNWNVPQGVVVTQIDDLFYNPDHQFSIVLAAATSSDTNYNEQNPADVLVTVFDNERAFSVSIAGAGDDRIVSENGVDVGAVKVRLSAQPQAAGDVYIVMTSLDAIEGTVSPQTLTFDQTDWNTWKSVAIQGVADNLFDGDQTFLVRAEVGPGSLPEFLVGSPSKEFSVKCIDNNGVPTTYASGGVNRTIPDLGTVTSNIVVPPGAGTIGDLNVSVNINHTYVSDLIIVLISPGGQRVTLFNRAGGSGVNINAIIDDEADSYPGRLSTGGEYLGAVDETSATGTWTLEVTDAARQNRGTLVSWGLNFSLPPAAPLVAASLPTSSSPQVLSSMDFQPILAEAFLRWQAAGVSTTALAGVNVQVADLPGVLLGQAAGNTIWLDRNAAGWGWFVDTTPRDDREFVLPGNQGEQHRMDLLTVIMHELGHVLGHDHDADGVMAETLAAGVRRTGLEHDDVAPVDQVFGQSGEYQAYAWLGAWLHEQFDSTHGRAKRRR